MLALISVIDNGLILSRYLLPGWFVTPLQQGIGIICLLIIATALACLPLRWLKDLLGGMAILYLGVFVVLGGVGIWWLISGHPAAVAPGTFTTLHNWLPSPGNFSLFGVVVLAFLGVDIPLLLSAEVRGGPAHVRRASRYVWWGSALAFLAYIAGTFSIMVIIPGQRAGNVIASALAVQAVFGPLAGNSAAIVLSASQMAIAITYILIFARVSRRYFADLYGYAYPLWVDYSAFRHNQRNIRRYTSWNRNRLGKLDYPTLYPGAQAVLPGQNLSGHYRKEASN